MKPAMILPAVAATALIACALAFCWPSGYMVSRDIGCAKADSERGKNICNDLSESMEWTWMGHAIVSPGWRLTWDGLGRVYCRDNITAADIPVLESLKRGSDWRLEDGADDLLRLIANKDGKGADPENSVFNPKNAAYILKGGCTK